MVPHVLENRYIVGKVIGSGGFGCVFEAFDALLHVPCVVKIVSCMVTLIIL